nr:hypothetical protein CFP56_04429 [Quercus suber]
MFVTTILVQHRGECTSRQMSFRAAIRKYVCSPQSALDHSVDIWEDVFVDYSWSRPHRQRADDHASFGYGNIDAQILAELECSRAVEG